MLRQLLLAALITPAFAAHAQAPAPAELRKLWPDWRSVNSESLAAEARRSAEPERTVAEARSLGERVGQLVASGDCEGGERMAREAGDFPLVEAVRDYCRGQVRAAS